MAFRLDKLTIKAQESVVAAQQMATERGHADVNPLHLLQSLMAESAGIVCSVLKRLGADLQQLQELVVSELDRLPTSQGGSTPQGSRELEEVFESAATQAQAMQDEYVSTEHLLLSLTKVDSSAQRILQMNGVCESDILTTLQEIRGSARVTDQNPEDKYQALQRYGIDLVERANQGKLDPVVGRDAEIRGWQDRHRRGVSLENCPGGCSPEPEEQTRDCPRHRCASCRDQVPG